MHRLEMPLNTFLVSSRSAFGFYSSRRNIISTSKPAYQLHCAQSTTSSVSIRRMNTPTSMMPILSCLAVAAAGVILMMTSRQERPLETTSHQNVEMQLRRQCGMIISRFYKSASRWMLIQTRRRTRAINTSATLFILTPCAKRY